MSSNVSVFFHFVFGCQTLSVTILIIFQWGVLSTTWNTASQWMYHYQERNVIPMMSLCLSKTWLFSGSMCDFSFCSQNLKRKWSLVAWRAGYLLVLTGRNHYQRQQSQNSHCGCGFERKPPDNLKKKQVYDYITQARKDIGVHTYVKKKGNCW